jgi:hypothetical protein
VISVNPVFPPAYNHGLRNPSTGFPAANSLSLIKLMTLANPGEDALVPDCPVVKLSAMTANPFPAKETSGNPRPERLKIPGKLDGREAMNDAVEADWYSGTGKYNEKPPEEKGATISGE